MTTLKVMRGVLVLSFGWTMYLMLGTTGTGRLQVEIRDKASGQTVPAMVCITSLEDHKWRTPPDGAVSPPYSTARDFYTPGAWKPGDIGLVRVTNGDYRDNNTRSSIYRGASAYPFWQEAAVYFVSQPFSITLPAGRWRLAVARGIEYLPVFEEFVISANQTKKRNVALARWVDMPKRGWYSGDDHVHYPQTSPEHSEFLLTWARAEDVHVCNILRMGDVKQTYFEQSGYGKTFRYQKEDYVLVPGQEDPRDEPGHTIALNIAAPVRDTSRYHLYDFMFDGVHAQGGLTGYAHNAWSHPWDSTVNVVQGKIDFFEILQFRRLGLDDYYDFLNLGFKLSASAGSDLPWGNTIGEVRVYAHTGGGFSTDAWFAALKRGRTFVTNGPMLMLDADGAMPGDDLGVTKNATIRIRARAWAPEIIGSPKKLELISNGRVIQSVESSNPNKQELRLEFALRGEKSQWIAARVTSHNGALAHTSPIYLIVDGDSFRDLPGLPRLIDKRLKELDRIDDRLRDSTYVGRYAAGEADALVDRLEQARVRYRQLAARGATVVSPSAIPR